MIAGKISLLASKVLDLALQILAAVRVDSLGESQDVQLFFYLLVVFRRVFPRVFHGFAIPSRSHKPGMRERYVVEGDVQRQGQSCESELGEEEARGRVTRRTRSSGMIGQGGWLSTRASSGDKGREREGGEDIIYVASHEREMKDWIEAPCEMQERKEAWLWDTWPKGCQKQRPNLPETATFAPSPRYKL